MVADPKPPARIVDPNAGRHKIRTAGCCRVCGRRPGGHPLDKLNRAHLVPKGQGGDDVDENIVPLCGSGTTGCHGILTTHPPGWVRTADALRRMLWPDEITYIIEKKGADWLDRVLPKLDSSDQ